MRANRPADLTDATLFFVGGPVKSGTTWLTLLLDAHPDVSCRGEGHFPTLLLPGLNAALDHYDKQVGAYNAGLFAEQGGYPTTTPALRAELYRFAIWSLLDQQREGRTVGAIGEKTPRNVEHLATLSALFPEARFVFVERDGRDCLASNWAQQLRTRPDLAQQRFGGDVVQFAQFFAPIWTRFVARGRLFALEHPERALIVRYEDLHADPVPTAARVLDFLGVDPVEAAHCVEATRFSRLTGRNRGQESDQSFFRKGVVGDGARTLPPAAIAAFEAVAGELL